MTTSKLKDALLALYGWRGYIDVEEMLDTTVDVDDNRETTVAAIARLYNFDAEKTAAFYLGANVYRTDYLIDVIRSYNFRFYADVTNEEKLGYKLMEDYVEQGLITSDFYELVLYSAIDYRHLGWEHKINNSCVLDKCGYLEVY